MSSPIALEIDVHAVRRLLASPETILLLDCREPSEHAIAHLPEGVLIPMNSLPDRIGELESHKNQRVIVHCHHGGRSLRVAAWLRQQGFEQAQSMAGGIDAWSVEIDSQVARY